MRFKHGDTRKDGYRFWGMTSAGYAGWLSPTAWLTSCALSKARSKARMEQYRRDPAFRAAVRRDHQEWIRLHPVHTMLHKAKERAKQQGAEFDLTPDDICIPARCPVLGIKLVHNRGKVRMNSPTLDRIRPSRGYVKSNVIVVSQRANTIKSNATPEQILKVGKFYRKLWRQQ